MQDRPLELFGSHLKTLIQNHHTLYRLPCMAEYAEELISRALSESGTPNKWHPNRSHAVSTDIVDLNGVTFSVKSGAYNRQKRELTISGSRLGKHGELSAMLAAVEKDSADYYICLARDKEDWDPYPMENEGLKYYLFTFHSDVLDYQASEWRKVMGRNATSFNYEMSGPGIRASIRPSMSHQLWTTVQEARVGEPLEIVINENASRLR
jgi:hypothetical protein